VEHHFFLAWEERLAALEIRANIAARELFEEADSVHEAAVASREGGHYREAALQFMSAEALFFAAQASALERRRIAAEAINEANRRIEEMTRAAEAAGFIAE